METLNCPQCGSLIERHSIHVKLVVCSHCSSNLLIEKSVLKKQDIHSHIQSKTSLIKQSGRFIWRDKHYTALGFLQFVHNEGYRTEWWLVDKYDNAFWLSEDDENFFLTQEKHYDLQQLPPWEALQPNRQLVITGKNWLVTEKRQLHYRGIQGALPLIPDFRNTLNYTYLVANNAETLILIFTQDTIICRQGYWLDPFEIKGLK